MLDVFTEEIELIIKDGLANLYWYKGDLQKAWLRAGVPIDVKSYICTQKDEFGKSLTKRQQMDMLYECLRKHDYNRRLEISRNFVRILVEHTNFSPQDEKHRIGTAEKCSLKLKELIRTQNDKDRSTNRQTQEPPRSVIPYETRLHPLKGKFEAAMVLESAKRGYALESLFSELMHVSNIPVIDGFRIEGEQIDGAIKYDSQYYLIELKWTANKTDPKEIGHFYYKIEGKMGARGIFLSINGFSPGAISTLQKGKSLQLILLDGNHLANVIYGHYTFQDLLEYAIRQASLCGEIYCAHAIVK